MAASHDKSIVSDGALLVIPVEKQSPCVTVIAGCSLVTDEQRTELAQHIIALSHMTGRLSRCLVNGKTTIPHRIHLAKGIECSHAAIIAQLRLRSEEGIIGQFVCLHPPLEACIIDIR